MYSPHKKCYEGYEILMDPARWVVMGRFKRKENNWRIGSNPASLKIFRQAKISDSKRGVPGVGRRGTVTSKGPGTYQGLGSWVLANKPQAQMAVKETNPQTTHKRKLNHLKHFIFKVQSTRFRPSHNDL